VLKDLIKMHKGDHPLNFVVYDNDEALKLSMQSRKQKVKISQELLDELENNDLYYKLN
jgi:DNA polymerase-3 subunit alpha